MIDEKPLPTGVVTGPLSATLLRRIDSSTSGGSGSPKREIASAPTKYFSHSTSTPAHSMIETTEAVTSGPIPSPGRRVILCCAMLNNPFRPFARFVHREAHRQECSQRAVFGKLIDAAPDALQRRRDEIEVPHSSARDRLLRERAEDLDGALQQGLEVATAHRPPLPLGQRTSRGEAMHAPVGVVVDQLELGRLAEDAGHAAVAEQRSQVIRVRTHSQILIIDQVKLVVKNMNILAMIIAMA